MMSTHTLTTTQPSIEGELRIPAVEANLLPVEIVEERRGRRARRIALGALVVVAVLTTAWYGQTRFETSVAQDSLRLAEDDTQRVVRQQREFADLVATRAETQAMESQLSGLLADDLQWSRLLFSIRLQAPSGVRATSVVGALTDDAAAAAASPPPGADAAIGKLTVSGTGRSRAAVATYVDRLGRIAGLANPLLNSATETEGQIQFSVQLDITKAALGGRHTTEAN
jgi:Tfp pilus assembly protein PilN